MTQEREQNESQRRREMSDEDFIAQWAEATQPAFFPLHGTIEDIRKRDWAKVFYGQRKT
jgi:hypothetical protein